MFTTIESIKISITFISWFTIYAIKEKGLKSYKNKMIEILITKTKLIAEILYQLRDKYNKNTSIECIIQV